MKVNASLIYKLEQGRVPSWPLLAALARVYNISIADMCHQLTMALEFPGSAGLIGIPAPIAGSPGPLDDLEARVRDLEEQVLAYQVMCGEIQDLGQRVADIGKRGRQTKTDTQRRRSKRRA